MTSTKAEAPARGPDWFQVLLEARRLARRPGIAGFTSLELSRRLKIARPAASVWCSKFVRWRYAEVTGTEGGGRGRGRAENRYSLTEWGFTRKAPGGRRCPTCKGSGRIP